MPWKTAQLALGAEEFVDDQLMLSTVDHLMLLLTNLCGEKHKVIRKIRICFRGKHILISGPHAHLRPNIYANVNAGAVVRRRRRSKRTRCRIRNGTEAVNGYSSANNIS